MKRALVAVAAVVLMLVVVACGDEGVATDYRFGETVVGTVVVEKEVAARPAVSPGMPAPAPAWDLDDGERVVAEEDKGVAGPPGAPGAQGAAGVASNLDRDAAAAAAQQRIIVRTVDMEIRVDAVPLAIEDVSRLATDFGGWVVSTEQTQKHRGSISVRVPAGRLDEAISHIRALAAEVESERVTSQDFTDEYSDTSARVRNLEATQAALLMLFDRAEKVEDAVTVQTELTKVQEEIERLTGRLKLLEQTSAFSLVNVRLQAVPSQMSVDGGTDLTLAVGRSEGFRASLIPPEGIDEFVVTWDFGDGSPLMTVTRTAATLEEGTRITAPASHVYYDDTDSPFIVTVKIEGSGKAGLAEGEDTLIATVGKIPAIDVFAGESMIVEEGEAAEFVASFTRPEGLDALTYKWDFGDGSALAEGELGPGVTTTTATHAYPNHRPYPFTVTLTVEGESEAGKAEGSSTVQVFVEEAPGWVIGGWEPGQTVRNAGRGLVTIGAYLVKVLIWLGIFSPIWIPVGAVAFWLQRRARKRVRRPGAPARPPYAAPPAPPTAADRSETA